MPNIIRHHYHWFENNTHNWLGPKWCGNRHAVWIDIVGVVARAEIRLELRNLLRVGVDVLRAPNVKSATIAASSYRHCPSREAELRPPKATRLRILAVTPIRKAEHMFPWTLCFNVVCALLLLSRFVRRAPGWTLEQFSKPSSIYGK